MNKITNTEDDNQFDSHSPLPTSNGKHPFHVDDSYFDSFSAQLNTAITDLEEIKQAAPTLYHIPKYNPFNVPAGYFDNLPALVQESITDQQPHFSIKEWLFQLIRPNFAFPVAITILIATAAIRLIDKHTEQPKSEVASDFSLEEQLYAIDENVLVDLLNDETDAEINPSSFEEPITTYLIDNNVDETSLDIDLTSIEHENE